MAPPYTRLLKSDLDADFNQLLNVRLPVLVQSPTGLLPDQVGYTFYLLVNGKPALYYFDGATVKAVSAPAQINGNSFLLGDGSSTLFTIAHNFNTWNVVSNVWQINPSTSARSKVDCEESLLDTNTISFGFNRAPGVHQFQATIVTF